jgi:LysM repeat protein
MAGVVFAVSAGIASGGPTTAAAGEYVVQQGDTLVQIARSRMGDGARGKELAEANKLAPPYALHLGQRLVLPAGWVATATRPATAPAREAGATTRPAGSATGTTVGEPSSRPPAPLPSARAFRASRRGPRPSVTSAAPATQPIASAGAGATTGPAIWDWLHLPPSLLHLTAVATGLLFVLGALLWWVFFAVCLRGACWFALVKTTLGACFRLALYLVLLGAACAAIGMAMPVLGAAGASVPAMLALGSVAVLVYFVASLVVARQVLGCQWRSVVTVLVMATFVWDLLATGLVAAAIVAAGALAAAG